MTTPFPRYSFSLFLTSRYKNMYTSYAFLKTYTFMCLCEQFPYTIGASSWPLASVDAHVIMLGLRVCTFCMKMFWFGPGSYVLGIRTRLSAWKLVFESFWTLPGVPQPQEDDPGKMSYTNSRSTALIGLYAIVCLLTCGNAANLYVASISATA